MKESRAQKAIREADMDYEKRMMKMIRKDYQYIRFHEKESTGKTKVFSVLNKRSEVELAEVKWYGPWRQYCFFPLVPAIYSVGCFQDIIQFIEYIKKLRNGNPD